MTKPKQSEGKRCKRCGIKFQTYYLCKCWDGIIEELQSYLIDYFEENLIMPSFEEIGKNFGWASKNAVFKKMKILEYCDIVCMLGRKYSLNPERFRIEIKEIKPVEDSRDDEYWRKKAESYNT